MKLNRLLCCAAILAGALSLCCRAAESSAIGETEFYNLVKLLAQAQRIVVAEIGTPKNGFVTLTVQETLKAPENDPKYVVPEMFKRAEALLADDKAQLPEPQPLKSKAPATILVRAGTDVKLPPQGNQALFFLWNQLPSDPGSPPKYRLAHPQCIYDLAVLPQVKLGLNNPRSVADGRYLRDWDAQMATRAKERTGLGALRSLEGGEIVMGLRIKALRPQLALRGDNSFSVNAQIENTLNHDLDIYDGPADGYGVLLRAKNAPPESALILRLQRSVAGVDAKTLEIVDTTDFVTVPHQGAHDKELFADVAAFPAVAALQGEYLLRVFYSSSKDGHGTDLQTTAWTGTLLSNDVPLLFKPNK
jgi:hypothetical protein